MRRALRIFLVVLAVSCAAVIFMYWRMAMAMDVQAVDYADLGETKVVYGGSRGLVILLADNESMDGAIKKAKFLAVSGRVVGVVNIDKPLAVAAEQKADCLNHVTLLDVYAQFLQQRFEFAEFGRPALMGVGRGGSYLAVLLAQAPNGIFSAGISFDNPGSLLLPAAPCGAAAQVDWQSASQAVSTKDLSVIATPWTDFSRGFMQWADVLWQLLHTQLVSQESGAGGSGLPLVELPQAGGGVGDYFVVVLSGDGGWANIDKDIAEDLGGHRVAVVGWNSLRYFWQPKTPEVMATDLATVIRHYRQAWHKSRVMLVGFSLGADVLPFMVSRLPAELQQMVGGIVLLSPSRSADFQFHVSDWLGSSEGSPNPLLPELAKIRPMPVLCIYGADEDDDTVCTELAQSDSVRVVRMPGDHHFDGDYAAVNRLMLPWFPAAH